MRRRTTMNLGACIGYTGSLTTNDFSIGNRDYSTTNLYNGKSFYDGKNYRWIIKCINGGYEVSTDLIECMQEYHDLLKDISNRLTSYSTKWTSKIKHQSTLSSYNTTKRSQLQTIRSREKLAQLFQNRCNAIQQVITGYQQQVNIMYPSQLLGTAHKHYRSKKMERAFKAAYSHLRRVSDRLDNLRKEEKQTQAALREARIQCQNLGLNETTSKSKLSRANDHQETKQRELRYIKENIARTEEEYNGEKEIYRGRATEIYEQCRIFEQERLDQIRETLLKFTQAVHSPEYSTDQDTIYENLLSEIEYQQDTLKDLNFWAQTYRVSVLVKSTSAELSETNENGNDDDNENTESQTTVQNTEESQRNEIADLTTIEDNTNQLAIEDQEEQSVADETTTPIKTKPKKKKTTKAEPSTPNAT